MIQSCCKLSKTRQKIGNKQFIRLKYISFVLFKVVFFHTALNWYTIVGIICCLTSVWLVASTKMKTSKEKNKITERTPLIKRINSLSTTDTVEGGRKGSGQETAL